jgi:hypothetical protein
VKKKTDDYVTMKKAGCPYWPRRRDNPLSPLSIFCRNRILHTYKLSYLTHFDPEDGGIMYLRNVNIFYNHAMLPSNNEININN